MNWDCTVTDGEVKALVGPVAGLNIAEDDFDVTIIVRNNKTSEIGAYSTTDDYDLIRQAGGALT